MGCGTFLPVSILIITLPYYLTVLIVGMPHLGAIPASTVPAFDLPRKNAHAALPVLPRTPGLHELLDAVKNGRFNNGRMAPLHIILRHLSPVHLLLFREKIHRVNLLQQSVALILFIGENGFHHSPAPHLSAPGSGNPLLREHFGNSVRRMPLEEHSIDSTHRPGLLLVNHKTPVRSPVIAQKPSKGHAGLSVREPLSHSPCAVLGNTPALLLGQGGHYREKQLPLCVKRPDILFLKIALAALLLQFPDGGETVNRIPGKS